METENKKTQTLIPQANEVLPVNEPAEPSGNVLVEGDPEAALCIIEKKAELAARFTAARNKILASQTFAEDWVKFGEGSKAKYCLTSAGAERVACHFDIKFKNVSFKKETFTDAYGKAFRYVYTGEACMGNRVVYATGVYSSRDKFLGKVGDEYKAVEDVNENSIQMAAYHIFCGNAIKILLGLRSLPYNEWAKVLETSGRSPSNSSGVSFGKDTSGGTSSDDSRHQKELAEICIAIANYPADVAPDKDYRTFRLIEPDEQFLAMPKIDAAKKICETLSSFKGEKGIIKGRGAKDLSGKWLLSTLAKARELKQALGAGSEAGNE